MSWKPRTIPAGKPPGRGSTICSVKMLLVVMETRMWWQGRMGPYAAGGTRQDCESGYWGDPASEAEPIMRHHPYPFMTESLGLLSCPEEKALGGGGGLRMEGVPPARPRLCCL